MTTSPLPVGSTQSQSSIDTFGQTLPVVQPTDTAVAPSGVGDAAALNQLAQDQSLGYQAPSSKEHSPSPAVGLEQASGVQSVEQLQTPEIPVEVEKYIQEARQDPHTLPTEIVVAGQQITAPPIGGYAAQPVIILPITLQQYQKGKKSPTHTGLRWIAEWTEKIEKMFPGSVMFRQE